MDLKIMKFIIKDSGILSQTSNEWQSIQNEEEFPVIKDTTIDVLSKTITKLLSYKVSHEAHQRYSVRLNLIDILRDWMRVKGDLENIPIFKDTERLYNLLIHILKKYLSEEILNNCDNVENLLQLAEILYNSSIKKKSLIKCFVRVVERIISLDQTEKSEKFLLRIIDKSDALKLESSFIEKIYISQKSQFIEKPLADYFVVYCSDENGEELLNNMDYLFRKTIDSPILFQLISNQLKELFVMTKYAQTAQNFIQTILNKIEEYCSKSKKDILNLYPTNLQFCVILLRMKSCFHTENSRNHTVQSLKDIFLKDYNDALILVSHFPEWLPVYLEFFDTLELLTQDSDMQINDEINHESSV